MEIRYSDLRVRPVPEHRSRVCLIYTGGTMGSVPTDSSSPTSPNLRPASLVELLSSVPQLGQSEGIELGLVSFEQPVDSSAIGKSHWLAMACAIEEHYEDFDGFVILHGTDTMAYSAAALSFILNNLAKPVVLTGSQLPIQDRRGDAVMNLLAAVHIAGYKSTGLPLVPEVTLCFMDRLLRGNRATKVSASSWQGFDSPNYPWLGTIGESIHIRKKRIRQAPDNRQRPFYIERDLADDVRVILVHPGLSPAQLEQDLMSAGIGGAVLMTYGAGSCPSSPDFLGPIRAAIRGESPFTQPLPLVNITQCLEGTVEMRRYEASAGLLEAGVASGDDMTLEAALAKMYWALGRFKGRDIRSQLQRNRCGEKSQSLLDLSFSPGRAMEEENASPAIEPPAEAVPGRYSPERLKSASLRVLGLGLVPRVGAVDCGVRIFINRPGASEKTNPKSAYFAGEFSANQISQDGTLLATVSRSARAVVDAGPVAVSLVGVNADVWCRSIHLALYLEAE